MKCVTKKFHGFIMQNNDKELCTKSVLHMQSLFFFAIVCLFFCHSDCHRCLALHDFIFCLRKFINESFAFSPG